MRIKLAKQYFAVNPLWLCLTLTAFAILTESGLSYLGFGIQPLTPTWGNMLNDAQTYMTRYPWVAIFPGMMIFLTVISVNFVGDGLRDAFDPRSI